MRIYLDNAATSFPKPDAVYAAVDDYQRRVGASVGRGLYVEAVEATAMVGRCRKRAASLLNAEEPHRIAFTFNGTDSLNIALHGLLRPGDHVVTSVLEHNSVLRPLRELEDTLGVTSTRVPAGGYGVIDPDAVRHSLRPNTRVVVLTHASNVTGAVQPIEEVGRIAREAGIWFVVDAAQTAGQWPIDLAALPVDVLACSGHKGLLGPLGTGLLYLRPGIEEHLGSFRQGGTGTTSEDPHQPQTLPEKYEPGNHNAPGLAGLEAALTWLKDRTVESVRKHESQLVTRLLAGLTNVNGVTCYGPPPGTDRTGVVSLNIEGFDPQDAAAALDQSFGIQVRAGLHCAPGAHEFLGTLASGGTVRFSVGPFTTDADIDAAIGAVRQLAGIA